MFAPVSGVSAVTTVPLSRCCVQLYPVPVVVVQLYRSCTVCSLSPLDSPPPRGAAVVDEPLGAAAALRRGLAVAPPLEVPPPPPPPALLLMLILCLSASARRPFISDLLSIHSYTSGRLHVMRGVPWPSRRPVSGGAAS